MRSPSWLEPLPDAAAMREMDRWAIEERGVPSRELMERAGAGLARVVEEVAPDGGPLIVVCGKGNNGGDGFVAARLLRERGREVRVLVTAAAGEYRGDARANLEALPGPPPEPFSADALDGAAVIVDALLGTGFSGEPREPILGAIRAINAAASTVVACDVPSGVDASTGVVAAEAVLADATATFAAAKPGLWIRPGKVHAGSIRVIDIGIPPGAPVEPDIGLIHDTVLGEIPRRTRGGTKFTSGHVLVCGGSPGLTGAPCMTAMGAMRAGAGYVTACVPSAVQDVVAIKLTEVMSVGLPDEGAADLVLDKTSHGGSLVVGPGLGRQAAAFALARELTRRAEVALVLDADGLNAHVGHLELLAERAAPTVLTPHAGELGRLLGIDSDEVERERLTHAREAARRSGAILLLKGDDTIVAEPEGRVAVSPRGSAALATAGTGDVLSGVLAALLAKRMDPFTATCAGVRLHAVAGSLAAALRGADGVIATDVIDELPRALDA
jgi:ADP-dependent NAD(P)H-hydrate dehydratase / NAD(P)H-hydrate epimerase